MVPASYHSSPALPDVMLMVVLLVVGWVTGGLGDPLWFCGSFGGSGAFCGFGWRSPLDSWMPGGSARGFGGSARGCGQPKNWR